QFTKIDFAIDVVEVYAHEIDAARQRFGRLDHQRQRRRFLDRLARDRGDGTLDSFPPLIVQDLRVSREPTAVDLDQPHPSCECEQFVVRWRGGSTAVKQLLGVERSPDVAVCPLSADDREVGLEPASAELDEVGASNFLLVLYDAVPAAAMVGFEHELPRQRVEGKRFGAIGPAVERGDEERGRNLAHVVPHAELVREERQHLPAVAQHLEENLLVEAAWVLEIGPDSELRVIKASEIIVIADEMHG